MYCAGQVVLLPGTRYDMVKSRSVAIFTREKRVLWYDIPPMFVLMTSSLESSSHRLSLEIGSHATNLNAVRKPCRRSGVREYLVWRVLEQAIDWFVLRAGHYERLVPDAQGVLRSEVFPGLWLDTAAVLRGDIAAVLATVQHGLASPEHETFVARLHPPRP